MLLIDFKLLDFCFFLMLFYL